jgi:hypothetical protein
VDQRQRWPENGLVRLVIESDRDRLLEGLVRAIRAGLDYPALLGALAEASAREVRPYPHVGYKYHAFMVLHAVHRSTLLGRAQDRWLPVLWSADVFKASQAAEQRQGAWSLDPLPARPVPPADQAERALRLALEQWDAEAGDAAVVDLLRAAPRGRLFETLFRYGARDFRAIGHKAITVANCHRLLGVVDPDHAEPMLRSLVLALQNHAGESNPATSDLAPDRPWRRNLVLAEPAPKAAPASMGQANDAVVGMLQVLRDGSDEDASRAMRARLDRGVPEADLWTAVFLAAGDLMLKQSGIISVHANTTANALHYAYRHVGNPVIGPMKSPRERVRCWRQGPDRPGIGPDGGRSNGVAPPRRHHRLVPVRTCRQGAGHHRHRWWVRAVAADAADRAHGPRPWYHDGRRRGCVRRGRAVDVTTPSQRSPRSGADGQNQPPRVNRCAAATMGSGAARRLIGDYYYSGANLGMGGLSWKVMTRADRHRRIAYAMWRGRSGWSRNGRCRDRSGSIPRPFV